MKEIQTNGITILLVEVPDSVNSFGIGATCHDCNKSGMWHCAHADTCGNNIPALKVFTNDVFTISIDLPQGQWEILGKSTELSEEQMKGICWQVSFGNYTGYKNYNQAKCSDFRDIVESSFSTVQESYLSLLEANGIVDRNLYEKPDADKILDEYSCNENVISKMVYREDLEQYQEAQSKVKTYLVLKRI